MEYLKGEKQMSSRDFSMVFRRRAGKVCQEAVQLYNPDTGKRLEQKMEVVFGRRKGTHQSEGMPSTST